MTQCPANGAALAAGGTFSGNCSLNVGNTLIITGNVIWQSGTLTIEDVEDELAGLIISNGASLTVQAGAVVLDDADGDSDDSNIAVENGGTVTVETGASLTVEEDITIESGGQFTIESGASVEIVMGSTVGGEVNVAGILDIFGSLTTLGSGANGNLEANGGTITIYDGGTVDVSDDLKAFNGGTVHFRVGSTGDIGDNLINAETGTGGSPSQGTFIIDGSINVADNVTIIDTTPDSGLTGAGSITAGGTFTDNEAGDFLNCGGGMTCTGGGVPTPVTLISFYHQVVDTEVQLFWSTASELNNYGFHIQRSSDGITFKTIGFVRGNGTTNEEQHYTFSDQKTSFDSYYRLQQEDYDGTTEDHMILYVKGDSETGITVFPNPFFDQISINGRLSQLTQVTLSDMSGQSIYSRFSNDLTTIQRDIQAQLDKIASGQYLLLRFVSPNQSESIKLVKM